MISPHTPPGTEVVALLDIPPNLGRPALHRGRVYTVDCICEAVEWESERYGVVLREEGAGEYVAARPWWKFWASPERRETARRLRWFRKLDRAATPEFYEAKAPVKARGRARA
jgi:hypothetical protein